MSTESSEYQEMTLKEGLELKSRVPGDQIRRLVEDVTEYIISTMESRLRATWGEKEWERLSEAVSEIELDLENILPSIKVWVPNDSD